MPIETICKGCARKLRVADEHAGRKARCPHCKSVYEVPNTSGLQSSVGQDADGQSSGHQSPNSETAHWSAANFPGEMWRMRTAEGAVYGPVSKTELDEWCREGRIAASSELQEQDSTGWVKASSVYPSLHEPAAASSSNPFASSSVPNVPVSHPYQASVPVVGHYGQQHRGGMILTFGIVSWVGCLFGCFLFNLGFAIAAWVMGRADLAAMRAGRMDPSGQSATQAGMILGMVNVIITAAAVILYAAFFVIAISTDGF